MSRYLKKAVVSVWFGVSLFSLPINAAETSGKEIERIKSEEGSSSIADHTLGVEAKFGASLDLRPSWSSTEGSMHTENELAIEYRPTTSAHVGYTQEFQTNLYSPGETNQGVSPHLHDGYLRGEFKEIWKNGRLTFTNEARVYLPTHAGDRDAGLVTALRNYFKFNYEASEMVELAAMEVPILHVYNKAGSIDEAEEATANPVIENRFFLVAGLSFMKKTLNLKLPLIVENARHSDFQEGAKFNNGWSHKLWVYPELTYSVGESTSIGMAYYSENLVKDDFSALALNDGFSKGVFQVILQQSL